MRAARRTSRSPSAEPDSATTDPLPGLPGPADPVAGPVLREALLDPVGDPEQRQLAQGGEVAGAEVVASAASMRSAG